jgi:hypothetical protein
MGKTESSRMPEIVAETPEKFLLVTPPKINVHNDTHLMDSHVGLYHGIT